MTLRPPTQYRQRRSIRLIALLTVTASLGLACATVDNDAVAAQNKTNNGTTSTHYWYDGDKKRHIVVSRDHIADFSTKSVITNAAAATRAVGSDASPVFVDANGASTSRALPGGVLIRFRELISREQADAMLSVHGTHTVRAIGGSGKSWLVYSEPGMPTLDLANKLYESGQFESAAPNWWKRRTRK